MLRTIFFRFLFPTVALLLVPLGSTAGGGASLSHQVWNDLLQEYVTAKGQVNYAGFQQDSAKLNTYLTTLAENHPDDSWTREEQLAYWINAYNAFTVQLIIRNYPVGSIKELGGKIYKVNTPWDIRFIHLGGQTYDLNNLEHGILRKQFDEPRIHFAVNCASVSCPRLRNEAFVPGKIDAQLDDAARKFINNPKKNIITGDLLQLSKIFSWFKGDFTKNGSLIDFLDQYTEVAIQTNARIKHLDYDWNLNE